MKQFEKITTMPPELRARFNNFIVTEFDDSMSVEMQLRVLIKWIIKNINLTNDIVDYLNLFIQEFDDRLSEKISEILEKWLNDGTLEKIIMETMAMVTLQYLSFWEKKDGEISDTPRIIRCIKWCHNHNKKMYIDEDVKIFVRTMASGEDTPNVDIPSNFELEFIGGSVMSVMTTDRGAYTAIRCLNVDNVTITNAKIVGERDSHEGDIGQQGYGIAIQSCNNVKIINPDISKCWGDGIYIGMAWTLFREESKNITIENGYFHENRRMGLTVASGENIYINRCLSEDIGGSLPSTGFHVEPENGDKTPFIRNVNFIDCHTKNCENAGFGFASYKIALSDEMTLNCINCSDFGSNYGVICYGNKNYANGDVSLVNFKCRNNKISGVNLSEYNAKSPKVTFENIEIIDSGRNYRPEYPYYYAPIMAIRGVSSDRDYVMGNFVFNNPKIYLSDKMLTYSIYIYNLKNVNQPLENVEINNPVFKNRRGIMMLGGIITDSNKELSTDAFATELSFGGSSKIFSFSNKNSNGSIMKITLAGKYPDKQNYTILNEVDGNIRIIPPKGKAIYGLGKVDEVYESYYKGSRLVLENKGNGEWFVVEKIGSWNKVGD